MGYGPYFDSSEDSWAAIGSKLSLPQYAAGNNEGISLRSDSRRLVLRNTSAFHRREEY